MTAASIALGAGMAEATVRYHLAIAAKLEPSIRDGHRMAAPKPPRITASGRKNLEEVLALYRAEGRVLSAKSASVRERALGLWLHRRRQEAAQGILLPIYADALKAIPGWDQGSTKKADDEARWKQRLTEVATYRAHGNDWPRHSKTDVPQERLLGVWLHVQRIKYRAGRLDPAKEGQLDAVIPGWRQGRAHTGGRGRIKQPGDSR